MKKVAIIIVIVLGGAILLWGFQSSVRAADVPDKTITIDYIKDKKPAVSFPHNKHAEQVKGKCSICHVNADGTGGIKPELKAKPADMAAAMQHPFHKDACTKCHKDSGKGPTICTDCHK